MAEIQSVENREISINPPAGSLRRRPNGTREIRKSNLVKQNKSNFDKTTLNFSNEQVQLFNIN